MNTYGYIRTSRQRIEGSAGSAPEAQAHQLRQEGVPEANIHRDVGISGGTGTNSRAGWRALDSKLVSGDTLVAVAIYGLEFGQNRLVSKGGRNRRGEGCGCGCGGHRGHCFLSPKCRSWVVFSADIHGNVD